MPAQLPIQLPDCALHVSSLPCSCILSKRVSRYRTACLYGGVICNVSTSHLEEIPSCSLVCFCVLLVTHQLNPATGTQLLCACLRCLFLCA
jgi:hypothetical protein